MIYVSAMSLGKHSYKVTVLCYCIENNIHRQKRSEKPLPGIQKNKHKNTEIITYITEKLKSFKTP